MRLTEAKLKELILETMEEDRELFTKALRKALESQGAEHRETFEFLLDALDIPLEKAKDYIDLEEVAEMFMNIENNEQFKTLRSLLGKFNISVSDLKEPLSRKIEALKKDVKDGAPKDNTGAYVAKVDLLVSLMNEKGEDLVEFGKTLSPDAHWYMANLVSSKHRPLWAPMVVMSKDVKDLLSLLHSWYKSKTKDPILTDDQLIQMYKSPHADQYYYDHYEKRRHFRQTMREYTTLPEAVKSAIAAYDATKKDKKDKRTSRIRMSLKRKK